MDCRSPSDLAFDPDMTAGLTDETIHLAQSQASSAAIWLGGEERLQRLRLDLSIHSAAGVAD